MANLVKLYGTQVELPFQGLQYSLTPAASKLQEGLAAFEALKRDGTLHGLPLAERQQVTRFLYQFGHLLFRTLFPTDHYARLESGAPLLLELQQDWSAYPWELLNDGNRWLALAHGVVRFAYPPVPGPVVRAPGPLRVLGASALPLPLNPASRLGRDTAALGTRFVASLPHLGDAATDDGPPIAVRLLEHATLPALEQALARQPHVLLFSGFASEEGWYLESERLTPQCAPWEWLLQRVREAAPRGLRLMVLADSLGLAQPLTAVQRTRELLRAGVPAVIRCEGHVGRARLQAYLEALLAALAEGTPVEAAHQGAVRGLFRDREEAWDWSFLRLYPQSIATPGERVARTLRLQADETPAAAPPGVPRPDPLRFATPPAPPLFRGRRRVFNRAERQKRLLEALLPGKEATSPLVFLSGPAGSGKTHLALEMARRLRRRFAEVLYLPGRALLPDPDEHLPAHGLPAAQPVDAGLLLSALATHLGAEAAPGAAPHSWQESLQRRCADGQPRLVILDRWERRPGYEAFCHALLGLPHACRVLLLSRQPPPLVPGTAVVLEPLSAAELEHVCGPGLHERLKTAEVCVALREALEGLCSEDLFVARLLRRVPRLPESRRLAAALAPVHGEEADAPGASASRVLALLVEETLAGLPPDACALLPVLAFFPWLVHRDVLAEAADLQRPRLDAGLDALAWAGWLDAWDGGRFWALHPRLHGLLGERVLGPGALARLQPRLLRVYRRYLTGFTGALRKAPANWLRYAPPLLSWAEERCENLPPAWVRGLHRLGVERVNLADLALLLADAGEWEPLERLVNEAAPLGALRELAPLTALLHRALLVAGERQDHPVLQADALNRLAAPLVEQRQAEPATALLERALHLLQHTTGWAVLGETYRLLSRCYEMLGRLEAAENLLNSATELAQQIGDSTLLTHASQALARIWARRGEHPAEGQRQLARQMLYLRQNNRPLEAALVLRAQAELLLRQGEHTQAREHLEHVLEACHAAGDVDETARTLLCLADCCIAEGDAEGAFALVGEAAAGPAGGALDLEEQGRLLSEICRVFEQRSQIPQALDGYLRIRAVLEQIGDREALIGVLDHIGGLYFQLGEQAKSTQCYEERLLLQAALSPS